MMALGGFLTIQAVSSSCKCSSHYQFCGSASTWHHGVNPEQTRNTQSNLFTTSSFWLFSQLNIATRFLNQDCMEYALEMHNCLQAQVAVQEVRIMQSYSVSSGFSDEVHSPLCDAEVQH